MLDPRRDLRLALADYHVARIGGIDYPCVFTDPGVDVSGVQTSGVTVALRGYRQPSTGAAVIHTQTDDEVALAVGATVTEVKLFPGEARGPYTVSYIEPLPGGLVRLHCRGSA